MNNNSFWQGKRVLVTGHTGFKGSWLCLMLHRLGAEIIGVGLEPAGDPHLFGTAQVGKVLRADHRCNINDLGSLKALCQQDQPQVIFHLAAQPLVRPGYRDPVGTFQTNVMGTVHLLEAARQIPHLLAVVVITTDKVYANQEWAYPYRECDALGGRDPYSASKAACELAVASYRASFGIPVATARAGNVIGGGDWTEERLLPDCLRAFTAGMPVRLRFPRAVRPWQHVLDPLRGYLLLAEQIPRDPALAQAWNFGPRRGEEISVLAMVQLAATVWGIGAEVDVDPDPQFHEAGILKLDSAQTEAVLGWIPRWSVAQAVQATVSWHRAWLRGEDMHVFSLEQIQEYAS